jgi:hypothetical protein
MGTVGAVGVRERAEVDAVGRVRRDGLELEVWVGAGDGWHLPSDDVTTRQRRPAAAPLFETAVRVPGGDVIQRVYGVATPDGSGATVLDIENASGGPCSIAFVVRIRGAGALTLAPDRTVVRLNGVSLLTLARPARLWIGGASVRDDVVSGRLRETTVSTWRAPVELALLLPVPHRTGVRGATTSEDLELARLADAETVARGWDRQLDRGLRTEVPGPWQARIDAARADLLLAAPTPATTAALEDWGFDAEAAAAWMQQGWRGRRAARRRSPRTDPWSDACAAGGAGDPVEFLDAMRQVLVRESKDAIELLPGYPGQWLGQHLALHDVPLRAGNLSCAVRWHGARPALLWDAPAGVTLRAPALDPQWQARGGAGEALLAAPPAPLLAMGTTHRAGERVEDPDSFG